MPIRQHIEVLGRVHAIWGAFGVLSGVSLAALGVGMWSALESLNLPGRSGQAGVAVFAVSALALVGAGAVTVIVGRALRRHHAAGRSAAIALAVPNMVIVPFGTAIGIYTCWVLLNDDARREFGRPLRRTAAH